MSYGLDTGTTNDNQAGSRAISHFWIQDGQNSFIAFNPDPDKPVRADHQLRPAEAKIDFSQVGEEVFDRFFAGVLAEGVEHILGDGRHLPWEVSLIDADTDRKKTQRPGQRL